MVIGNTTTNDFYPRPPRGGRLEEWDYAEGWVLFLSTPSARRATGPKRKEQTHDSISIHALREEGDVEADDIAVDIIISIHALREEGDYEAISEIGEPEKFLSTPSARRATSGQGCTGGAYRISIHALREEGDASVSFLFIKHRIFLSTPSARRATQETPKQEDKTIFLSTPSARRATPVRTQAHQRRHISIHALREEGDKQAAFGRAGSNISIHALREEGDTEVKSL